MISPVSCILVEDEAPARRKLAEKLSIFPEIEIVGEAEGLDDAYHLIRQKRPKAAFLDVELTGGTAFQLLDRLERAHMPIPWVVIVTAHPQYAIEALNDYKRHVVQFLTKPMLDNWKVKGREAVDAIMAAVRQESGHYIIKSGNIIERIPFDDLVCVVVVPSGKVNIMTDQITREVNMTLTQFLEEYPESPLMQIHRAYAVNKNRVLGMKRGEKPAVVLRLHGKEKSLEVGERFFGQVSGLF